MIKFSVIIPTYNRLKNLQKALNSVLSQTYQEFEIIIVDDGSTDGTKEYIQSLNNPKIVYVWQENSGLPSVARNKGISLGKNPWITFLDSDDFWESNKLEVVKNILEKRDDIVAVSHGENLIRGGRFEKKLLHGSKNEEVYEELLFHGNVFSTSAMTVKKEVLDSLGGFDTKKEYYIVEDYELWLRVAQKGKIFSANEICGNYSLGESDNISANVEKLHQNLKHVVFEHIQREYKTKTKKLKKIHGARIDYYLGRSYQLGGEFQKAIPILLKSIYSYPFSLKKYIAFVFALLRIQI